MPRGRLVAYDEFAWCAMKRAVSCDGEGHCVHLEEIKAFAPIPNDTTIGSENCPI